MPLEPYFIGDHPALDLMNTIVIADGAPADVWRTDADVWRWLDHFGWAPAPPLPEFPPGHLLARARALREVVRTLVHQRKAGLPLDPAALNRFLAHSRTHHELIPGPAGVPQVVERRETRTAEQCLAPLAEAAAALLAEADFSLVRPCESERCVLWFYDRTKAHRRRWCSMAACGNRHKVAAFRQRHLPAGGA